MAAFPISAFDLAGFSFQVSSLRIPVSAFQRFSVSFLAFQRLFSASPMVNFAHEHLARD